MNPSPESIFEKLKIILTESFEIAPERITYQANLFEDLELDSIDAVDLAMRLQQMTGKRVKVEDFKSVHTVGDVIQVIQRMLVEQ